MENLKRNKIPINEVNVTIEGKVYYQYHAIYGFNPVPILRINFKEDELEQPPTNPDTN